MQYIHTYAVAAPDDAAPSGWRAISGASDCIFELPRFGLEFILREGKLLSADFSGYHLSARQQLVTGSSTDGGVLYTLPDFKQYLVLEGVPGSGVAVRAGRADELVLVPAGIVTAASVGVQVTVASGCDALLKVHCYEVHPRFGHLRASSVLSRLQLAALYAATSSLLLEPLSRMTGAQMAMGLLRQCWGNRPFTHEESAQLSSVGGFAGHLTSGLRLLVHELHLSACQLSHLHVTDALTPTHLCTSVPVLDPDAATAYLQDMAAMRDTTYCNLRLQLTPAEEVCALGIRRAGRVPQAHWMRRGHFQPIDVPTCTASAAFVAETEATLSDLVTRQPASHAKGVLPAYPLCSGSPSASKRAPGGAPPLQVEMHAELRSSWDAYHASADMEDVRLDAQQVITDQEAITQEVRAQTEQYLLHNVSLVPADVGCHGSSFRLMRLADTVPSVGLLDLVRMAWQPQLLEIFNPFLTAASRKHLHDAALVWLQLCVLEDRLGRLRTLVEDGSDFLPLLLQELKVRRTWAAAQHPQWLAFEAEGQLQIRPAQHWVAQHLIHHPGAIDQLNMGEGKTRVILPMLALHWADGQRVVRLNFLSTLLDEAYGHLHQHLCASVLGRKLFTLPFHRDVHATPEQAYAMRACLKYCEQEGGVLLVAPEHRLSLQLKGHELWAKQEQLTCAALSEVSQLPYLDLLDESDELLHHRFQLIYACGTQTDLPSGQERAEAAQALLHIVSHAGGVPLSCSGVAVWTATARSGAFSGLRLLPGDALQSALPDLHRQWTQALLEDHPHALRWMRGHALRDLIVQCMTDASRSVDTICGEAVHITAEQRSYVLALRGLLACGLLQHCLKKRHCVDYGVDRSPTARKRLAVPFRAALAPSERSEFAQPDVALVLTTLSYYYDGLTLTQLLAALKVLFSMGGNAQKAYYDRWRHLSWDTIDEEDRKALDDVAKLDPSNSQQLELLHKYYSHNMAVVDFWLNFCVFPTETKQSPQRLACNPWHLADNARGEVVGFSGTNDNHRLLPLQVRQHTELEEQSLRATNGKMMDVILGNPTYTTLPIQGGRTPAPVWQTLLDAAVAQGVGALMDCGALLAGISNSDAANYLLARLDPDRFRAVCFFDVVGKTWVFRDVRGRCLPRHSSPIAERDSFVLFDDARSRGADLQLRQDAVGMVTLGPGLCKDKLMQAAGRMRQLGRGQTLRFVGTQEISGKMLRLVAEESSAEQQPGAGSKVKRKAVAVRKASKRPRSGLGERDLTSLHILQWVMDNTVNATLGGILEWSRQGVHFAATKDAPERLLGDEVLRPDDFYGGDRIKRPVASVVEVLTQQQRQLCGPNVGQGQADMMTDISERAGVYGAGHTVLSGQIADEECERELEQEEEQEEEREREVLRVAAANEVDWDFTTAVSASTPEQLPAIVGVMGLAAVAQLLQPEGLHQLGWSSKVFCTRNFTYATQLEAPLNEYMRGVDSLLLFPTGQMLLLSEREADAVQAVMWAHGTDCAAGPMLLSLCYACHACCAGTAPKLTVSAAAGSSDGATMAAPAAAGGVLCLTALPAATGGEGKMVRTLVAQALEDLVCLQLFNGEATYGAEASPQFQALHRLMRGKLELAEALVRLRGKQSLLPCSDLERACEDFASADAH